MEEKIVEVWTIQMAAWRITKERDIKFLDITAKSGIKQFAPEFDAVVRYKQGMLGEVEYTDLYLEKMAASKVSYPKYWDRLTAYPKIAIACYCKPGAFCHRHLFIPLMREHVESLGYKLVEKGELLREEKTA